jgi:hypothetical protein
MIGAQGGIMVGEEVKAAHLEPALREWVAWATEELKYTDGVSIIIELQFDQCELVPCWIFWKRRNWKTHLEILWCSEGDEIFVGDLPGFEVGDVEKTMRAIPRCIREAKEAYCP